MPDGGPVASSEPLGLAAELPRPLAACELAWLTGITWPPTLMGLGLAELVARGVLILDDSLRVRVGSMQLSAAVAPALLRLLVGARAAVRSGARRANVGWITDRQARDSGRPAIWVREAIVEPLAYLGCAELTQRIWFGVGLPVRGQPTPLGLAHLRRLSAALDRLDFAELERMANLDPRLVLSELGTLGAGVLLVPELYHVAGAAAAAIERGGERFLLAGLDPAHLRTVPVRMDVGRYDLLAPD